MLELEAVDFDPQLRDVDLLFDLQVADAGDAGDRDLHFVGLSAQCVEVVAIEFDRHLGFDAREHVRNQVGQRLLHRRNDARNIRQRLADFMNHFLARAGRTGVDRGDDLGDVDAFGVLIELGPAGLAYERSDVVEMFEAVFDSQGDVVRAGERRPRRQEDVDLHRAFVEGRRKSRSSRTSAIMPPQPAPASPANSIAESKG